MLNSAEVTFEFNKSIKITVKIVSRGDPFINVETAKNMLKKANIDIPDKTVGTIKTGFKMN